jgi:hypothetical protein
MSVKANYFLVQSWCKTIKNGGKLHPNYQSLKCLQMAKTKGNGWFARVAL